MGGKAYSSKMIVVNNSKGQKFSRCGNIGKTINLKNLEKKIFSTITVIKPPICVTF